MNGEDISFQLSTDSMCPSNKSWCAREIAEYYKSHCHYCCCCRPATAQNIFRVNYDRTMLREHNEQLVVYLYSINIVYDTHAWYVNVCVNIV